MNTIRNDFRLAYAISRRALRRPETLDPVTVPDLTETAWAAGIGAACRWTDETHGVMCWKPEGRADRAFLLSYRDRLRRGRGRAVKPLPR